MRAAVARVLKRRPNAPVAKCLKREGKPAM
jgi:hypothetical protein